MQQMKPDCVLEPGYEAIYMIWDDCWDYPRSGIADFNGKPHFYEDKLDKSIQEYSGVYSLTPISATVFNDCLNAIEIFTRWSKAFHNGEVDISSHPALPETENVWNRFSPLCRRRYRQTQGERQRPTLTS